MKYIILIIFNMLICKCYSQGIVDLVRVSLHKATCSDSNFIGNIKNTFILKIDGVECDNVEMRMDSCIIEKKDKYYTLTPIVPIKVNIKRNLYLRGRNYSDTLSINILSDQQMFFSINGLDLYWGVRAHAFDYIYCDMGCISPFSDFQIDSFTFNWIRGDSIITQKKIIGSHFNIPKISYQYNHSRLEGDIILLQTVWYSIDSVSFEYNASNFVWLVGKDLNESVQPYDLFKRD